MTRQHRPTGAQLRAEYEAEPDLSITQLAKRHDLSWSSCQRWLQDAGADVASRRKGNRGFNGRNVPPEMVMGTRKRGLAALADAGRLPDRLWHRAATTPIPLRETVYGRTPRGGVYLVARKPRDRVNDRGDRHQVSTWCRRTVRWSSQIRITEWAIPRVPVPRPPEQVVSDDDPTGLGYLPPAAEYARQAGRWEQVPAELLRAEDEAYERGREALG